jgi:hypothetical protein
MSWLDPALLAVEYSHNDVGNCVHPGPILEDREIGKPSCIGINQ